jgi:hypothetical protein
MQYYLQIRIVVPWVAAAIKHITIARTLDKGTAHQYLPLEGFFSRLITRTESKSKS